MSWKCPKGQVVTDKSQSLLPSYFQPLERDNVICTTIIFITANICQVRLLGRHCAKGLTYIISINPNNHFWGTSQEYSFLDAKKWGLKRLSASPSGSQLGNGIAKTGIPTPEPRILIIMLKNFDSPLSSGSGPNTSIISALPISLCAQTNQANALLLMRQVSKPWHLLLLALSPAICEVLEGFSQSRCDCSPSSNSASSREPFN